MGNIDISADAIDDDMITGLKVTKKDFVDAGAKCNPSSLRESVIEMSDVSWKDIGGIYIYPSIHRCVFLSITFSIFPKQRDELIRYMHIYIYIDIYTHK